MRKRSQQSRSLIRREEIIRSALDCFVENGYTDTTMDDIRTRSGASNGSIYHHFKSKEQLAAAVYLEGIADFQSGFLAELEKNPGPREGIAAMIAYVLHWMEENPAWARFLLQTGHTKLVESSNGSIAESNLEFFAKIVQWLEKHREEGEFRPLPIEIYLPLILAPCYEFGRFWLSGMASFSIASAAESFAEAAWLSLGAA
ncbi:MAG: TetR/AcrR family transcriptional regulator [Actinobacteria bacterium]|nr:TetR/AcrR family transcriptional regulator [Actinomycetota bacterium]